MHFKATGENWQLLWHLRRHWRHWDEFSTALLSRALQPLSVWFSRAPVSSHPSTAPGTGPRGCPSQAPVHRAEAPCGPSPAELSSWCGAPYGPLPRCPGAVRDPDLLRKVLSFSSPHLSWELWCRHGGSSRLSQPHQITLFLQETFQGRAPAWSQLGCPRLC